MIAEKRDLELQIANKNREIEALNLRIEKMTGFHKREVAKLEEEINAVKQDHQRWLEQQERETQSWNEERAGLKEKIHQLGVTV